MTRVVSSKDHLIQVAVTCEGKEDNFMGRYDPGSPMEDFIQVIQFSIY